MAGNLPGSAPVYVKFVIIIVDLSTAYMVPPTPGTVSVKGPIRLPRYDPQSHSPETSFRYSWSFLESLEKI